ncbi:MAG: hypothetical protein Q7S40_29540 [Opitutaceae bacterium]|nr:hypothetical protein [Opitutaceae bacterium]
MKILNLFLALTASAWAQSETLDLGSHGRLTLYLLGDWKVDSTQFARQGSMTITPKNPEVNASCTLNITFPETDRFDSKSRLKLRVEADCYDAAERSVERKAIAREFNIATGYGFFCNFTDPDLRGKPPEKDNFKVTSIGKIRLAPDVLIDVQILADGFRDEPYQQLLGAIEGMEYTPGRG